MIKASRSMVFAGALALAAGAAQAQIQTYYAYMDGPSESPPVPSPGTGFSTVIIDLTAQTMHVVADFSGLVGTTTVAHIHGPTLVPFQGTASVMTTTPTFTDFPAGVTEGHYDHVFDMTLASSYRPGFITDSGGTVELAFARFVSAMDNGQAYFNIHTTFAGGGEIRGFFQSEVPAPGAGLLLAMGGMIAARRRRA